MVPVPPVVSVAPKRAHRFWALPLVAIGFLVLGVVVLSAAFTASRFSSIKRPYAIVPADAQAVEGRMSLTGATRYPATGQILFVTIREPQLSLLSWMMIRHDNDAQLMTYEDINGTSTPQQQTIRGRRQMVSAKQAAEYVALSKLGFPIVLKPGNIVVDQIVCFKANAGGTACIDEAPSGKVLKPDDELVSIDGTQIKTLDDLRPILARHKAGDNVEVAFNRPGKSGVQKGTVQLIQSPDDKTRVIIGFYPFDTTEVGASPFPVVIDTAGIGGPSAGLAFTLTLIDELTPGELTGGQRVAVTGTIDVDGKVGAIGGLPQKASAVKQTGTKYFIVPASQSKEEIAAARAVVGDSVQIIPVATLDEALTALAKLGGNADKLGTPGKDFKPAG
jgi:PDZ domain-containing protein